MPKKPSEKYDPKRMVAAIDRYVNSHCGIKPLKDDEGNLVKLVWQMPVYEECLLLNGWTKSHVYDLRKKYPELNEACERLKDWKAIRLERGGLCGMIDKSVSIFLLKQLGYRDAPEDEKKEVTIKFEGVQDLAE